MDRRSLVIVVVIGSELLFRLAYANLLLPAGPPFDTDAVKLLYTAAARVAQCAAIILLALDLCGLKTESPRNEALVGIGVSLAFGAAVLLSDLAIRPFFAGGWLSLLLSRQTVAEPMLFFLVGCVLGPFAEELFFRGTLYAWLRERMPPAVAIALSSLLFAGLHPGFAVQFIGGLLFASLFEWRKSIWAGFIVHAAANLGIWLIPWIIRVGPK